MRIVLIQEERYIPAYTGSSKSSRGLMEGLAKAGHECIVLSPLRLQGTSETQFLDSMAERGIEVKCLPNMLYHCYYKDVGVYSLPMKGASASEEDLQYRVDWIKNKIRSLQADIVIVSADPRYYMLRAVLEIEPEKAVFIVHSHEHVPFGPLSKKICDAQLRCLHSTPLIIAVSEYSKHYLQTYGDLKAKALSFPVYGDKVPGKVEGFNNKYLTLINGGIEKGVDIFIALAEQLPTLRFGLVSWNLEPDIHNRATLQQNIHLLDPVDDIEQVLANTGILLVPSIYPETFGLIVVEAMLRGIPVIASNLGGLKEAKLAVPFLLPVNEAAIDEGKLILKEQDLTPWLDAIETLVSNPAFYKQVAEQSRTAAALFVSSLSVRPFEDLFESLTGTQARLTVAVTDAYDAGFLLAEEIQRRGFRCINIDSSETVHAEIRAKCDIEKFDAVVEHKGNIQDTLEALKQHKIHYLLPGNETGVLLADALSEKLLFRGNGSQLSEYRRNKYLMAQAAQAAGLNIPRQFCSGDLHATLSWAHEHGEWPVIVKPPHSIASEDVYACRNEQEVEAAFNRVMNKRNLTGLINSSVIIEELLFGEQYVLDTVSCDGHHGLAGVWHYGRPSWAQAVIRSITESGPWPQEVAHASWQDINYAAIGSNSKEFMTGDDPLATRLFSYATKILDAIGVKNGPAHFELMEVKGETLLVEVGARLHGAPSTHWMCRICGGFSQLDQTIDAYIRPQHFLRSFFQQYSLRYHGWKYRFHPWRAGRFVGFHKLERFHSLPSFRRFYYMSGGKALEFKSCVGVAALIHPDREVLLNDVKTIEMWEKNDLFLCE